MCTVTLYTCSSIHGSIDTFNWVVGFRTQAHLNTHTPHTHIHTYMGRGDLNLAQLPRHLRLTASSCSSVTFACHDLRSHLAYMRDSVLSHGRWVTTAGLYVYSKAPFEAHSPKSQKADLNPHRLDCVDENRNSAPVHKLS